MFRPAIRSLLGSALAGTLVGPLSITLTAPADAAHVAAEAGPPRAAGSNPRQISYTQWSSTAELNRGRLAGVRVAGGRVGLGAPLARRRYDAPGAERAATYEYGHWTSPWTAPGFGLTELIPSWGARTPGGSWVQIEVRGRNGARQVSSWDTIARWSRGDASFRRSSLGPQADDLARVATDTWKSNSRAGLTSWQLRVSLLRKEGSTSSPTVDAIGAMASRLPRVSSVPTSRSGAPRGITLNVPRYSQMTHRGHYPRYGNGGEAWCSPTSTSMVLGYYDRLPPSSEYSWVTTSDRDRFIDHAARMTYDYAYRGTGNWSFNTAYASTHAGNAFVTRLRSLREAERFIEAGVPLVASVAFGRGELTGAPISSTSGHLMVIVGFTSDGNVVVNDPAAPNNGSVRRVYRRGQFENAWLPASGGLVYVVHTPTRGLPERGGSRNW